MGQLKELFEIFNFHTFVYSLFLFLASLIFIYETVKKICSIFGIKLKIFEDRNKQTKKIEEIEAKQNEIKIKIAEIEAESISHDKALEKQLNDLTKIVIDDRVDRMRHEILDMASAISGANRWYTVEQLRHTLKLYDEYEKFLKEHGMENGEVDLSIEIIKKAFTDKFNSMGGKDKKDDK